MSTPNTIVLFKAEEDTNLILPMMVIGDDLIENDEHEDEYTQEVAIDGVAYDATFHIPHDGCFECYVNLYKYDEPTLIRRCKVVDIIQIKTKIK